MTTYAEFVDTLVAMPVTGVNRVYPSPPDVESSTDYPIMFPRLPQGANELISLDSSSGLDSVFCQIVIAVERETLSLSPEKFALTIELLDNLNAALKAEMLDKHLIMRWELEASSDLYGWVISALVEGLI